MKQLTFAMAAITALTLGGMTRAEPMPPQAEKPAAAVVPSLTDESLARMLTDMGYEFRAEPVKGTVIYHLTFDQDGWKWHINVALSSDKQQLWITTSLATLTDENVPAAALLRLLEENDNIGPTTICYQKKFKQIRMALPLFNRGITPAVFRTYLNDFVANGKSTLKLCEFAKPAEKTDKAAAADAPKK